jgi:hypothetical protein
VTEQPEDTPPAPRRSVEVALARMEAKLDVAIAQHQARLDEHARRIHDLAVEQAQHGQRIGGLEQKAAATAAVDASKPAPVGLTTYIPIGISLVLLVLYLIEKYSS